MKLFAGDDNTNPLDALARLARQIPLDFEGAKAHFDAPGEKRAGEEVESDPQRIDEFRLTLIDAVLEWLETGKSWCEEEEQLHCEAFIQSLSIPPAETADRILRYETAIQRELYRAHAQLERLQRRRLGDNVSLQSNKRSRRLTFTKRSH